MESEPVFKDSSQNLENGTNDDSQKQNGHKVHIDHFELQAPNTSYSTPIERVQSQPIIKASNEIQRTPSTIVHVDSAEFQGDRIKTELSSSHEMSQFGDEKSSEYDAPIIDISEANDK